MLRAEAGLVFVNNPFCSPQPLFSEGTDKENASGAVLFVIFLNGFEKNGKNFYI